MLLPLNISILTISDTRTTSDDRSGQYLCQAAKIAGHNIIEYKIIPDNKEQIVSLLKQQSIRDDIDVIISTGGTGLTARDVTPEAVSEVIDKAIPGFGELFRWLSFQKIGTSTIQSRACGGVCNGTFIFALPGSPNACKDAWTLILEPQLNIEHRPCNFAELIPRLQETDLARHKS